ncbi:MAG TPA: type 1 glutamine amidotransferase domain-containing protein [Actinomycetota bacterium]
MLVRLQGKTVLILAGPDYEDMELQYPRYRLLEEGARVVIAGIGEQTYTGKKGYPVTVDVQIGDVDPAAIDAVVIPGGWAPDKLRRVPEVLDLVRRVHEEDKTVAFICHAGWVPISAGILKGRRCTSVGAIRDDMVNAGVDWVNESCVVDGNLVTARTPDDLPAWLPAVIETIARH